MLRAAACHKESQSPGMVRDKKIMRILPRKLLSSSFSAFARLEVGSEPARALRLRDSMENWVKES